MYQSILTDITYTRRSSEMVHQAALRRYLTNRMSRTVAPLQERASAAMSQYKERPLLKWNYPIFNVLHRDFQNLVKLVWADINGLILRLRPSIIVTDFENGVPDLTRALSGLVDQLYEIVRIPDEVTLNKLKREIRPRYEAHFQIIHWKCKKIPDVSDAVAGEKQYYKFLRKVYMDEISRRLDGAYDQRSITSVKLLISRYRKRLGEMVDKIDKLAMGEPLEDSFRISDISEDDSVDY